VECGGPWWLLRYWSTAGDRLDHALFGVMFLFLLLFVDSVVVVVVVVAGLGSEGRGH